MRTSNTNLFDWHAYNALKSAHKTALEDRALKEMAYRRAARGKKASRLKDLNAAVTRLLILENRLKDMKVANADYTRT